MLALLLIVISLVLYATVVLIVRRFEGVWAWRPAPSWDNLHPAVANLLLGGGKLTTEAVEATALALAQAGVLDAREEADGTVTVQPTDSTPVDGNPGSRTLAGLDAEVLTRLRQRAVGDAGRTPVAALGPGDGADFSAWWGPFARAVRSEARSFGLADDEDAWVARTSLVVARCLVVAACIYLCLERVPALGAPLLGIFTFSLFTVVPYWTIERPYRLTAAGRRLARQLRAGTGAERRFPGRGLWKRLRWEDRVGLVMPKSRRVWSSYGGAWHLVETSPLRWSSWGRIPSLVGLGSALVVVLGFIAIYDATVQARLVAAAVVLAVAATPALLWLRVHRNLRRLPAEAEFRGPIISLWENESISGGEEERPTSTIYYCASVEDPGSGLAWSFRVGSSQQPLYRVGARGPLADRYHLGDMVEVSCNPRRLRPRRITVVDPAPR